MTIKPTIKITKHYFKIIGHGNNEVTEVIHFFLIQHNADYTFDASHVH